MEHLISSGPLFAPLAIGWDIGAAIDNAMYQLVIVLATLMWAPHAVMFALARYLTGIAFFLATGIWPAAIAIVINVINSTNLAVTLATLALMLVGVGYLVAPYLPEFRLASLGRVVIFVVVTATFLGHGPGVVEQLETARLMLARGIGDSAFSGLANDPAFSAVAGSLSESPESGITNFAFPRDYDGVAGISAYDMAASAVPVCPPELLDFPLLACAPGEELSVSLPQAFRNRYMRHRSLTDGMSGDERTEAKERAWKGVSRLALTLPVTLVCLLDAVATVLFGLAAGFILLTLPIALLFAVFLPLENMATSLSKMYLNLFMYTAVVAVLTSIGVAGQLAALQTFTVAPLVGASALALLMVVIAIKVGLSALAQSFSSFGNSLSSNLGLSSNPQSAMVGAATGLVGAGVGLATGGTGLAMLALAGSRQGTTQGGALALGGGALMGRTPLRRPGMALGMAMMGRGAGRGIGQALAESSTAEAAMAGMSVGSGSPWALFYAMNRLNRPAAGRQGPGGGGRQGPAAPSTLPPPAGQVPSQAGQAPPTGQAPPARRGSPAGQTPQSDQAPPAGQGPTSPPAQNVPAQRQAPGASASPIPQAGQVPPAGQQAPQTGQAPHLGAGPPHPYRPAPNSPWRPGVDAAADRYGGAWVEALAARTRQVAHDYRQAGMSVSEVAARFADPQGQPALDSPGGRDVVRGLPADVCGTLNTTRGRAGVQAVVGDVVAPRFTRDRAAIARAVGGAVGLPREQQGDPAGDAAAALSARPEDLGGYYGSVGRFVALARGRGLDGATTRQVAAGAAGGRRVTPQVADALRQAGVGDHEARSLIRAAQLLPERLQITAAELPVAG